MAENVMSGEGLRPEYVGKLAEKGHEIDQRLNSVLEKAREIRDEIQKLPDTQENDTEYGLGAAWVCCAEYARNLEVIVQCQESDREYSDGGYDTDDLFAARMQWNNMMAKTLAMVDVEGEGVREQMRDMYKTFLPLIGDPRYSGIDKHKPQLFVSDWAGMCGESCMWRVMQSMLDEGRAEPTLDEAGLDMIGHKRSIQSGSGRTIPLPVNLGVQVKVNSMVSEDRVCLIPVDSGVARRDEDQLLQDLLGPNKGGREYATKMRKAHDLASRGLPDGQGEIALIVLSSAGGWERLFFETSSVKGQSIIRKMIEENLYQDLRRVNEVNKLRKQAA